MTSERSGTDATAADLRRSFDAGFARARDAAEATELVDLLAIRIEEEALALRLSEIRGLYKRPRVTRVPSHALHFQGISSVRGVIVPVYDLHGLLGHRAAAAETWMVVAARGTASVGLAFERFERLLRAPRHDVAADDGDLDRVRAGRLTGERGGERTLINLGGVLRLISGPHVRKRKD